MPALMVAAPSSGQGETLVAAALARLHRDAGQRVRVFKCSPAFLDSVILERAWGLGISVSFLLPLIGAIY